MSGHGVRRWSLGPGHLLVSDSSCWAPLTRADDIQTANTHAELNLAELHEL